MDAKNPRWANPQKTIVDLNVSHPVFGEIPFTANPEDMEPHGRELFARAAAGEFGPVADYVPPPEPVQIMPIIDQGTTKA